MRNVEGVGHLEISHEVQQSHTLTLAPELEINTNPQSRSRVLRIRAA